MSDSNTPMLQVRGLKKYFPIYKGLFRSLKGTVKAVDDLSFDLHAKETLGIVGESGCGKTTVGRSLLRLIEPTGGGHFMGKDIFKLGATQVRSFRKNMQIIFQDPYSSLNPRMTIGSIIGDALELHGIAQGDDKFEMSKELLVKVGLQYRPSTATRTSSPAVGVSGLGLHVPSLSIQSLWFAMKQSPHWTYRYRHRSSIYCKTCKTNMTSHTCSLLTISRW